MKDLIIAAVVFTLLLALAFLLSNRAEACEAHAEVYADLIYDDNRVFCHRSDAVGQFGIDFNGRTINLGALNMTPYAGYQHMSCFNEQKDKATLDIPKVGLRFRW